MKRLSGTPLGVARRFGLLTGAARPSFGWIPRPAVIIVTAVSLALSSGRGLSSSQSDASEPRDITIVSWNVENLFDTVDDPANPGDNEFTPDSWRHWTAERYTTKLRHIAEILDKSGGDVLCLQELENRGTVDDLARVLRTEFGRDYPHVIHREGTDHRGIDVAILSAIPPAEAHWLTPIPGQRDILVARFVPWGRPLTILVNHWKSRLGPPEETRAMRMQEAQVVRREVDRVLDAEPRAAALVVGDLNEDFDDPSLVEALRSAVDRSVVLADATGRLLYNLHGDLAPEQRGTVYYHAGKAWNSFDSISVSRSLLASDKPSATNAPAAGPWRVKPGSYAVLRTAGVMDAEGHPRAFRLYRDKATKRMQYELGYSDHLPVRVVLTPADEGQDRAGEKR